MDEPRDARTTPGWLRVPALLLLVAQAGWFWLSWHYALGAPQPDWMKARPEIHWFASWEMFTLRDRAASLVSARARYGGEWVAVDLEALFPTRWESGPRYARRSFYDNKRRLTVLAEATCGRLDERPEAVRFRLHRWTKRLGVPSTRPPPEAETRLLLEWTCGGEVPRPPGVQL